MRIVFTPARLAVFLAVLLVTSSLWIWLDPGRNRIQIVATLVLVEFVMLFGTLVQRPRATHSDGWRYLRPSFTIWLTFVLSCLAAGFLLLVLFGTDWARYGDRPDRMAVMLMAIGFGIGAILMGFLIFGAIVRWDANGIQQRTVLLQVREIRWDAMRRGGVAEVMRHLWLEGEDGTIIRASLDAHGIAHLFARLRAQFPDGIGGIDR